MDDKTLFFLIDFSVSALGIYLCILLSQHGFPEVAVAIAWIASASWTLFLETIRKVFRSDDE
jgi:hypothetical protein